MPRILQRVSNKIAQILAALTADGTHSDRVCVWKMQRGRLQAWHVNLALRASGQTKKQRCPIERTAKSNIEHLTTYCLKIQYRNRRRSYRKFTQTGKEKTSARHERFGCSAGANV